MSKKLFVPAALVFFGLVLRFVFSGMNYLAYALFFAAALYCLLKFCGNVLIKRIVCALTALGLVYLAAVEIPIIKSSVGSEDESYDYIIVLGAAVHGDTPSLSLIERMDAACRYLKQHPEAVAVLSGGQGSGENLSEAQAMFNWLTANGIDESRLILEDKSTSTLENLENSFALISERGDDPKRSTAIVTSEYHLYRAQLIGESLGVRLGGVAAHTTWLPVRVNYFIREAFGVTYQWIFG